MKRSALIVSIVTGCLLFFIATAYAVGKNEYTPVPKSPETTTVYIDRIDAKGGSVVLTVDDIQWYEGKAADEQFLKREKDSGLDGAPDGYYIVNDDKTTRRLTVDPNAVVLMQIYDHTGNIDDVTTNWNEKVSLSKFVSIYRNNKLIDMRDYPFHVTVENGKVVKIVQQYIP
ncbi:hypothetical protein [Paenibacillus humicola]|uniref:hypothetical protein n=1 Tax=Paenibacillus humicola TaxID=3110540 RepID=UPI00237B4D20|nr:hypothetical protein [Paenibacillus humicola]